MKPRIAITMGDPNGIGPEVALKALLKGERPDIHPLLIGDPALFERTLHSLNLSATLTSVDAWTDADLDHPKPTLPVLPVDMSGQPWSPGRPTVASGTASMQAVQLAIDLCMEGTADAMVTAPISKEAISQADYPWPGHTEFLAHQTGTDRVQMILCTDELRVALVTIHIPLRDVANAITRDEIELQLNRFHTSLTQDFGVENPSIAVLGLNPHAGDGGVIGREEIDILKPVLAEARTRGLHVTGPHPADGFFGSGQWKEVDGVLAMYHDQGLIPFKTLSFGKGVNFTAGLPILRTSPDHGTGFAIAGKGVAKPDSMSAAIEMARSLATQRSNGSD
ncbi:MAG: 4-hydroxythreonine-4-phosphate dehydrogenase PdxA [Balneolaceae bacterium]